MRVLRLVLALSLATLVSGCAAGGVAALPPGTQAAAFAPSSHRMFARVPIDQKEQAGGRNWVPIAPGTRVVCLNDPDYNFVYPPHSSPMPHADIRVQVLEGTDNGLIVLIPREALSGPPKPTPPGHDARLLLIVLGILTVFAAILIEAVAKAVRRRREVVRRWVAAHPGESLPDRKRRRRPGPGVPSDRVEDQTAWAAWLAGRNARKVSI